MQTSKPRILTWHVHGSYLYYLTQANCDFFVPVKKDHLEGYVGLPQGNFPWSKNVHEIAADKVKEINFDCILFQSQNNYLTDQFEILSTKQLSLPKIYLEHDPPRQSVTDTKHIVDNPHVLLVHVTNFNNLFWDNNDTPSVVIPHGVKIPRKVTYSGKLDKGIVIVNNLLKRGRRLGLDIVEKVRKEIPLDIIGMKSEEIGGLGEVSHKNLPAFISQYRFFFNPIRYTSLGLSLCEAMMVGMPIVALPTTEMPDVITHGKDGFLSNDIDLLQTYMSNLLQDKQLAFTVSNHAKNTAQKKFNLHRFTKDWEYIFKLVIQKSKKRIIHKQAAQQVGGIL